MTALGSTAGMGAMPGNDVDGAAALDLADVDRRVGRVEAVVEGPVAAEALADPLEEVHRCRGMGDGVDAAVGRARVAVPPADLDLEAVAALVPVAELEAGRLAHDDDGGLGQVAGDVGDH